MTFDDDQEEMIELVDSLYVYFFTVIMVYFIFRHSIHYFSFMDSSLNEKRSNNFLNQFRVDAFNFGAVTLRFYMLIIRVNIYDTVEDVLDTYYVFIVDFDDDEYVNELFFSLHGTLFFTMDNHDDRSFMYEDESDFSYDLYYLYYILWGKIAFFFFYTLEIAGKILLGFYISYLILFEIQAVTVSYHEDNYIATKRQS